MLGRPRAVWRVLLVLLVLASAYAVVLQPGPREVYSPVDKWFHAAVFALVWALVAWCWQARAWVVSAMCFGMGVVAELHQAFMPGFHPSVLDLLANAVGIGLAHGVFVVFARFKKLGARP